MFAFQIVKMAKGYSCISIRYIQKRIRAKYFHIITRKYVKVIKYVWIKMIKICYDMLIYCYSSSFLHFVSWFAFTIIYCIFGFRYFYLSNLKVFIWNIFFTYLSIFVWYICLSKFGFSFNFCVPKITVFSKTNCWN